MPLSQDTKELRVRFNSDVCTQSKANELIKLLSDKDVQIRSHFIHNHEKNILVLKFNSIESKENLCLLEDSIQSEINNIGFEPLKTISQNFDH